MGACSRRSGTSFRSQRGPGKRHGCGGSSSGSSSSSRTRRAGNVANPLELLSVLAQLQAHSSGGESFKGATPRHATPRPCNAFKACACAQAGRQAGQPRGAGQGHHKGAVHLLCLLCLLYLLCVRHDHWVNVIVGIRRHRGQHVGGVPQAVQRFAAAAHDRGGEAGGLGFPGAAGQLEWRPGRTARLLPPDSQRRGLAAGVPSVQPLDSPARSQSAIIAYLLCCSPSYCPSHPRLSKSLGSK